MSASLSAAMFSSSAEPRLARVGVDHCRAARSSRDLLRPILRVRDATQFSTAWREGMRDPDGPGWLDRSSGAQTNSCGAPLE
jgi:hypothetical protein